MNFISYEDRVHKWYLMNPPPEYFDNESSLKLSSSDYRKELTKLDLAAFPIIDDFEAKSYDTQTPLGLHLRFVSKKFGILTGFPWWDNVDVMIAKMKQFLPVGTIDNPFHDADQGWQILIWEHEKWVYVMEGEEPACIEFPIWFKVDSKNFFSEWDKFKANPKES